MTEGLNFTLFGARLYWWKTEEAKQMITPDNVCSQDTMGCNVVWHVLR